MQPNQSEVVSCLECRDGGVSLRGDGADPDRSAVKRSGDGLDRDRDPPELRVCYRARGPGRGEQHWRPPLITLVPEGWAYGRVGAPAAGLRCGRGCLWPGSV